jgi:hypothetical protein
VSDDDDDEGDLNSLWFGCLIPDPLFFVEERETHTEIERKADLVVFQNKHQLNRI